MIDRRVAGPVLALVVSLAGPFSCGLPDESAEDVVYDERFDGSTSMDVYYPTPSGAQRPAVVLVHGGGIRFGDKADYTTMAQRLARSGYVAATINYRLVPEGTYPRAIQDCGCALSFLRAHAADYDLDPARVAMIGYSGGAYLATMVGLSIEAPEHLPDCAAGPTPPPRAVISGAGKMDLRGKDSFEEFVGAPERDAPELWAQASPIDRVGPDKPPFLFLSGGADWINDIDESYRIRDALRAQGNDATLIEISGGGHVTIPGPGAGDVQLGLSEQMPEAWIAISDFLARTVGRP
jgi:acetyl esterase/lipase